MDGEETCSTSFCLPPRPPRSKRPGGKPWRNPPCAWLHYIRFGRNEDIRFSGRVGGGSSTLFVSLASVERVEASFSGKSRGGPPHSVPPPFKEKSAILHSYVSFRTLALQLHPNAFARGIYETIDDLQQSAMESILSFGNFWKLTYIWRGDDSSLNGEGSIPVLPEKHC